MYLTLDKILRVSNILESIQERKGSEDITIKDFFQNEQIDLIATFTNANFELKDLDQATQQYLDLFKSDLNRQNTDISTINKALNKTNNNNTEPITLNETILYMITTLGKLGIYNYQFLTLVDYTKLIYQYEKENRGKR